MLVSGNFVKPLIKDNRYPDKYKLTAVSTAAVREQLPFQPPGAHTKCQQPGEQK